MSSQRKSDYHFRQVFTKVYNRLKEDGCIKEDGSIDWNPDEHCDLLRHAFRTYFDNLKVFELRELLGLSFDDIKGLDLNTSLKDYIGSLVFEASFTFGTASESRLKYFLSEVH